MTWGLFFEYLIGIACLAIVYWWGGESAALGGAIGLWLGAAHGRSRREKNCEELIEVCNRLQSDFDHVVNINFQLIEELKRKTQ